MAIGRIQKRAIYELKLNLQFSKFTVALVLLWRQGCETPMTQIKQCQIMESKLHLFPYCIPFHNFPFRWILIPQDTMINNTMDF